MELHKGGPWGTGHFLWRPHQGLLWGKDGRFPQREGGASHRWRRFPQTEDGGSHRQKEAVPTDGRRRFSQTGRWFPEMERGGSHSWREEVFIAEGRRFP